MLTYLDLGSYRGTRLGGLFPSRLVRATGSSSHEMPLWDLVPDRGISLGGSLPSRLARPTGSSSHGKPLWDLVSDRGISLGGSLPSRLVRATGSSSHQVLARPLANADQAAVAKKAHFRCEPFPGHSLALHKCDHPLVATPEESVIC
jgi:hypothetical protein